MHSATIFYIVNPMKRKPLAQLRRAQRDNLHLQLDQYLNADDTPPEGHTGSWTVLDSLCLAQIQGAGVMLSIHTRLPDPNPQPAPLVIT